MGFKEGLHKAKHYLPLQNNALEKLCRWLIICTTEKYFKSIVAV